MKIAVINFSGNVGKTTIARHLLMPRIEGAELIAVESLNADEGQGQSLRGRQFGGYLRFLLGDRWHSQHQTDHKQHTAHSSPLDMRSTNGGTQRKNADRPRGLQPMQR